ncbi:MAG: metallophosphoesterase [Opitutales bacterium]
MPERTLIVGDVHGCADELNALIETIEPDPNDRWIFVGDLLNRGPDTPGVFDLVRELPSMYAILGNHEARLLRYRRNGNATNLRPHDLDTLAELRPEDWELMEAMRLTLELPEEAAVVVHGGFLHTMSWREQPEEIVTRIQVISPEGEPQKRSECPLGVSWAEHWEGPPYVYYGHTPREKVFKRDWSLGLDTGCVYGGHLTACVLPGRELVQVRAKRAYAS